KVRVLNGGVITTPVASDSFTQGITIAADEIEVDAASRISVASRGLLPSVDIGLYCGGSHGGSGGRYNNCSTNAVYGDYLQPSTFGTGGKQGSQTSSLTRGGGALKLVAQVVKLYGQLLATGESGKSGYTWGGGAGGSLWVDTQLLLGGPETRILANGGTGGSSGGPGGGGRIAIYYAGMQGIDPISQISVAAGTPNASSTPGEQGTLHLENRVVSTAVLNADVAGYMSRAVSAITVDFINAVDPASISNSTVRLFGPAGEVPFTAISAVNTVRYQFALSEALADGSYELRVGPGVRSAQGMGMDQNGNGIADEPGDVFVRGFVVDQLLPATPIVNNPPLAPAVNKLTQRKLSISGEREAQTAILVNGVQQVTLGSGAWSIPDFALPEGAGELRIEARDAAGNLSPAAIVKFNVDSLKPVLTQYSYSGNIREIPSSVWVRLKEDGSGLDLANSGIVLKKAGVGLSGQLSLDGDTLRLTPSSPLLEGSYSYEIRLQDNFGNLWSGTQTFKLDYTAPAAIVLDPYPSITTSGKQRFSGTKESSATIRFRNAAGNVVVSMGTNSSTTWQYDLTLSPGDNQLTVDQTDAAGNVSPRTPIQIRFDDQAPGPVVLGADPKGSGTSVKL
ncbi:Ig-like domain-containing protein, partial [Pseudomonas sp. BMS12]|uniref:Ig-like domain-containing protein n=1 Tax=Pseudomonas sp. BMS12 TaxID=1796033 RepID=UPI00191C050F